MRALTAIGSDLFAEGDFTSAGEVEANHVARWDGASWSALGGGLWGGTYDQGGALAVWDGDLYVGSYFTQAGDYSSYLIGRWITAPADAPEFSDSGSRRLSLFVPNPYHPMDAIRLDGGGGPAPINVDVYSVDGRRVRHLTGGREVRWDGILDRGISAPAGSYIILARRGPAHGQRRIVLLK